MKNKEINENQELKDLNNEFKTYVLYKILNYCTDNEISLQKYQIKYLGVKGSSYDHLIQKDSGFKLTQLTAMKL